MTTSSINYWHVRYAARFLAAKQEAFEESIRLKNQFRNLDEDEIEFLDSVLESTRAKEDAVKKETAEKLSLFRRQQEEADRALLNQVNDTEGGTTANDPAAGDSQWAANAWKKRKRVEKEVLKGVKLRKASSSIESSLPSDSTSGEVSDAKSRPEEAREVKGISENVVGVNDASYLKSVDEKAKTSPLPQKGKEVQPSLGLAAYSSDEEDWCYEWIFSNNILENLWTFIRVVFQVSFYFMDYWRDTTRLQRT